jgi:pimeloyl-ACP methyl ester carboxylesterase
MATFLFLHGSFHAAWNWHRMLPLVSRAGHRGVALDLLGHGRDGTPPDRVSLEACMQQVVDALDRCDDGAVLVAHSRNGIVISQAAERRPERVRGLVYLAAYMLPNGRSMMEYAISDTDSLVVQNSTARVPPRWLPLMTRWLKLAPLRWLAMKLLPRAWQVHRLRPAVFREALYHDCGDEIVDLAHALLEPEPHWAGFTPLKLSAERYGRVPRLYVECLEDRAVTPALQRQMIRDSPGAHVRTLKSSHSPFFSQPAELTALLCEGLQLFAV